MPTFALEPLEEVKGKLAFHKLYVDGVCLWDEFWDRHADDPQYEVELAAIQRRLELLADLRYPPPTKWKELKRKGSDKYKDYEIKTSNLRAYYFKIDEGNAVVLIGLKKDQKKDIARLRRIKSEYFDQLKEKKTGKNRSKPDR